MKRVTIKDVAERAGVSTATVSHVINNTRHVEENTRNLVEQSMNDLRYHPNSLARSLRSGETKTIGLIVPDVSNLFFADIARRIENLGYEHGYSVILCNSGNDLKKQRTYIDTLTAKQVDGVIFISAGESTEDLERLSKSNTPIVVADRVVPLSLADVVLLNNEEAGYTATKHLIDLGHTKIGCITGPSDVSPSMQRVSGYRRALEENDIRFKDKYVTAGDFTYRGGNEGMKRLLSQPDRPSAVFVLNDMMAIGAISTARSLGYRVPEDVSIVGFDDIELANAVNPALTTMAQPMQELADVATKRLIEKLLSSEGNWENQKFVLHAKLVVRESTAPWEK
ncbi:MAG: LacI family DNA-binding transcriptional regulator [Anaerolineales bacterium]|nr:LacI family DNA-binding transcriptional regulator [Anaerolineales bacterium]